MITLQQELAIKNLGTALVGHMPPNDVANLMNATLCADDDERLSDYQAGLIKILFDRICELSPEAMDIATGQIRSRAETDR
jgi:hypothetical protein